MIQIYLNNSDKYTAEEMAQMAVEAGCQWLIIADAPIEELRQTAPVIVELCREEGIILTFENNIEAARELGVHGVFMRSGANPAAIRLELGAEAIIGAEIGSADTATALAGADIDYYALPEDATALLADAKTAVPQQHYVALCAGKPDAAHLGGLRNAGFDGFCIAATAFENAADPVAEMKVLVDSF